MFDIRLKLLPSRRDVFRKVIPCLVIAALAVLGLIPPELAAAAALLGSTEVDTSFIKQYEDQVHHAYQRMGSKLRNFVRTSTKMPGTDITFPIIGRGVAQTKPRNGPIQPMNLGHNTALCTMSDRYAPEYIDKIDALKTNVDLQKAYAEASAWALGRYTDLLISNQLDTSTNTTSLNRSAIVIGSLTDWFARLANRDVPNGDGNCFAIVSPMVWSTMMQIQQFANSQWIGEDDLPFKTRMEGKYWNGVTVVPFTGLSGGATARKCHVFHRQAIGHGIAAEVSTEINYVPERVAYLVNSMLSQGAVLIDMDGVETLTINENA